MGSDVSFTQLYEESDGRPSGSGYKQLSLVHADIQLLVYNNLFFFSLHMICVILLMIISLILFECISHHHQDISGITCDESWPAIFHCSSIYVIC